MGTAHCATCTRYAIGAMFIAFLAIAIGAVLDGISFGSIVHIGPDVLPVPAPNLSVQDFERDGFLVVRKLISGEVLRDAQMAGEAETQRQHWLFDGLFGVYYSKVTFALWQRQLPFARVAFGSAAPSAAAALTGGNMPLRVLKDSFMSLSQRRMGCGWHVDDKGFWPALDNDTSGINVWIALSSMRASSGGGLAVVSKSSSYDWFETCRAAITSPDGSKTCDMATLSPECHRHFEQSKVVHDVDPGDAILLSREVFHRAEPFRDSATSAPLHRYNIRYVPETTALFDIGFGLEAALARGSMGVQHGSKLADAGSYYPRAWPNMLSEEREALAKGLSNEPSVALICRAFMQKFARRIW